MSLIASFWTLDAERRSEIVAAFQPVQTEVRKRRWLFLGRTTSETTYPWFDWIRAHAREEAPFEHSGIAMVDFDLILAGASGSVFDLGLPESTALSEHTGGSAALFDDERARAALARLESLEVSEVDVIRFYDDDDKPENWRSDPRSVLAAQEQLVSWFRRVVPGRIGLLMIG